MKSNLTQSILGWFLHVILWTPMAWAPVAQAASDEKQDLLGANVAWETGVQIGNILPNQFPGITEIMGLGGIHTGYRMSPNGFLESSFLTGQGYGASYKNLSASIRLDIPVETLVGIAYVGGNATYYKGAGQSTKLFGGGHVGGGVMAALSGLVWFRGEMRFTINPGTSLFIGLGFVFRFTDGGSAN